MVLMTSIDEHTAFLHEDLKEMDHSTEKWTMYFLNEAELQLMRKLKARADLSIARNVLDVDVGIVTGTQMNSSY